MHSVLKIDYTCISDVIGQITIDMCKDVLSDLALSVKECLAALAVTSSVCCKRCDKILSLVTIKNLHLLGVIDCLNFFNMLNIEKVSKI